MYLISPHLHKSCIRGEEPPFVSLVCEMGTSQIGLFFINQRGIYETGGNTVFIR